MKIIRAPGSGSGGSATPAITTKSTTNATVTTIDTVAIPTGKAVLIKADIVGIKDDFSTKGGFTVEAIYANNAGTVTLQGITNIFKQAETNWAVTFVISTTNVLIRVKGLAANNISWKCARNTLEV